MTDAQKLISFAQDYLQKQPFDIVHDLEHHQLVVQNCLNIIEHEKLTPNFDVILTSAWWHDVDKSYETVKSSDNTVTFFLQKAAELGVDRQFADYCVQTIEQHSFSQQQTTLEGKILFDADKIEYVNDDRIQKLVDDFVQHPDKYEADHLHNTHDIWIYRIQKVHDMMHFNYSRQVFLKKLAATETILEKFQQAISAKEHHEQS